MLLLGAVFNLWGLCVSPLLEAELILKVGGTVPLIVPYMNLIEPFMYCISFLFEGNTFLGLAGAKDSL